MPLTFLPRRPRPCQPRFKTEPREDSAGLSPCLQSVLTHSPPRDSHIFSCWRLRLPLPPFSLSLSAPLPIISPSTSFWMYDSHLSCSLCGSSPCWGVGGLWGVGAGDKAHVHTHTHITSCTYCCSGGERAGRDTHPRGEGEPIRQMFARQTVSDRIRPTNVLVVGWGRVGHLRVFSGGVPPRNQLNTRGHSC